MDEGQLVDDDNYHGLISLAMTDAVAALRDFNRFHTRFAGVLQHDYMASGLSVTAARLLYEIAQASDGVLASSLRDSLGLDAGHVSRMIAAFERRGWIMRDRGRDARQRPIHLTDEGRRFFTALDDQTRTDMEVRIVHLSATERQQLVDALAHVRRLLDAG